MKPQYPCLACLVRQVTKLGVKLSESEDEEKTFIKQGLKIIAEEGLKEPSIVVTAKIFDYIKESKGIEDPYEKEKRVSNSIAEDLVGKLNLKKRIQQSSQPFVTALKIAMAGNVLDFSAKDKVGYKDVENALEVALSSDYYGDDFMTLAKDIQKARKILFIGDNAGEIVFDRLLLDQMPLEKITYVVKGGPIVNDATINDAISAGIVGRVPVISTGASIQGVVMKRTSEVFRKAFKESDLVICKGQANYESLNDIKNKKIVFLLMAKCDLIAGMIGCEKDQFVMLNQYEF